MAIKPVHGSGAVAKNLRRVAALTTTGWIVLWTWPLYLAQWVGLVFWILGIGAGVGAQETWIGWALDFTGLVTDAAGVLVGIGMAISSLMVALGFLVAYAFYFTRGVACFSGTYSLIIMAVLFGFSFTPLCFLPLVWIWCLYVVISQDKD